MKSFHLIAILLTLSGLAVARENIIWDGADGVGHCRTGGSWWSFADHDNTSHSNFPGTSIKFDSVGAWVAKNGGIMDVIYTLEHSANGYAYYGIGFNFVDPEADAPQTWDSLCLEYSLTGTAPVQLQLKNYSELTHDNDYALTLGKQPGIARTCFGRADFAQPGPDRTDNTVFPIDTLLSVMHGIKLEATAGAISATKPLVSELKLKRITSLDKRPDSLVSVREPMLHQGVSLTQSGRVLSLQGTGNQTAILDLINTRGQILSRMILSADQAMEVSELPTGVYMARVKVGANSFSQRIALP